MDGKAVILCDGFLGTTYGKTAHGMLRYTTRYNIIGVIDRKNSGRDAGEVVFGKPNGITVYKDLESIPEDFKYLVIGVAPDGGILPQNYLKIIKQALLKGINIDSGLHQFLSEDEQLVEIAKKTKAVIRDVRKPPERDKLHFFTGDIKKVKAVKIAVMGTDSAIGKRTTAVKLNNDLNKKGIKSVLIGTGQTAWFQGFEYSIVFDSIINDFVSGEIENVILKAYENEKPEVLILEGQGNLTNPAYPGGFELIAAGKPDSIILQHAPKRKFYDGFPGFRKRALTEEIELHRLLSKKDIIAITLNHEDMTENEIKNTIKKYEREYKIPTTDILYEDSDKLISVIINKYPVLKMKVK